VAKAKESDGCIIRADSNEFYYRNNTAQAPGNKDPNLLFDVHNLVDHRDEPVVTETLPPPQFSIKTPSVVKSSFSDIRSSPKQDGGWMDSLRPSTLVNAKFHSRKPSQLNPSS